MTAPTRFQTIKIMNKAAEGLSFLEHLDELRERLIKSVVSLIIFSCVAYLFVGNILAFLIRPIGKLVYTSPADAFLVHIIVALFSGFIFALPIIIYQVWCFVVTGLKQDEKKYVYIFGPFSLILFILGALFAYFIAIPIGLKFLLGFSSEIITPMITVKNYVSFVATLILAFGIVFELPLILMFLTKIGIATPVFLMQKRKFAVVLILILSALITPPDVITQLILAGPLMFLYEIGIVVSKWVYTGDLVDKHQ